jgi:hypothetical protein
MIKGFQNAYGRPWTLLRLSHGENRGSSSLGSASDFNMLATDAPERLVGVSFGSRARNFSLLCAPVFVASLVRVPFDVLSRDLGAWMPTNNPATVVVARVAHRHALTLNLEAEHGSANSPQPPVASSNSSTSTWSIAVTSPTTGCGMDLNAGLMSWDEPRNSSCE